MFAQSYDPHGSYYREQHLRGRATTSQRHLSTNINDEQRRRRERAFRRHRSSIDMDHRRRMSELERQTCGLKHEEEGVTSCHYRRHSSEPTLLGIYLPDGDIDDDRITDDLLCDMHHPPRFIYVRTASSSLDEMDRDIEDHAPNRSTVTIGTIIRGGRAQRDDNNRDIVRGKSEIEKRATSGIVVSRDGVGVERTIINANDGDGGIDDDPYAPPHIIAREFHPDDDDDDDDDADDFSYTWIPR
jgi:hypothetical protein